VKALTKEKKGKENVLAHLELINLKNVSLLSSEELRIKIVKVEIEQLMEGKHSWKGHRNKGRVWIQLVSRKN